MKIKKELIKREIAGDAILVPVGKNVYDTNGLFMLNELGAIIWNLLPEAEGEADILEKVLAEYDVEEAVAKADIQEFLNRLRDMDVL